MFITMTIDITFFMIIIICGLQLDIILTTEPDSMHDYVLLLLILCPSAVLTNLESYLRKSD